VIIQALREPLQCLQANDHSQRAQYFPVHIQEPYVFRRHTCVTPAPNTVSLNKFRSQSLKIPIFRASIPVRYLQTTNSNTSTRHQLYVAGNRLPVLCCLRRNLKWENLLNLSMLKPSQSAKEIFKTYKTFIYEDIYYIT